MYAVIFSIPFIMCLFLYRRVGISPGFIVSSMLAISIQTFISIEYVKSTKAVVGLSTSHSYKFQSSYANVELKALLWYAFFFTLVFIATILGSKRAKFKPSGLTRARLHNRPVIAILLALTCYHALITKMKWIYSFDEYLILRDPNYYGVSDMFGSLIIYNVSLIGLLASILTVGYVGKSISTGKVLCSIIFLYNLSFQFINLSRWAALYLGFISLLLFLRNHRRDKAKAFLISILSIVIYYLIMVGRERFETNLTGFSTFELLFINSIANIFGGVIVFAHTLTLSPATYPSLYKFLSFSPLPSIIDNFSSIRDAQVRINKYGPYNSIAEAYWFGANYFLAFFAFVATCVFYIEKFWWKAKNLNFGTYKAYSAFIFLTFSFFMINQYPLRNSLRWLFLSFLISLWGYYFSGRGKKINTNVIIKNQ
jgi:hypothetical protein